jgi:hypothetical protein
MRFLWLRKIYHSKYLLARAARSGGSSASGGNVNAGHRLPVGSEGDMADEQLRAIGKRRACVSEAGEVSYAKAAMAAAANAATADGHPSCRGKRGHARAASHSQGSGRRRNPPQTPRRPSPLSSPPSISCTVTAPPVSSLAQRAVRL